MADHSHLLCMNFILVSINLCEKNAKFVPSGKTLSPTNKPTMTTSPTKQPTEEEIPSEPIETCNVHAVQLKIV